MGLKYQNATMHFVYMTSIFSTSSFMNLSPNGNGMSKNKNYILVIKFLAIAMELHCCCGSHDPGTSLRIGNEPTPSVAVGVTSIIHFSTQSSINFRLRFRWQKPANKFYYFQILCCENRKYLETVLGSDQPPARMIAARS